MAMVQFYCYTYGYLKMLKLILKFVRIQKQERTKNTVFEKWM